MTSISRRVLIALMVFGILATLLPSLYAQTTPRRRFTATGPTGLALLRYETVQRELKMTPRQISMIAVKQAELTKKMRDSILGNSLQSMSAEDRAALMDTLRQAMVTAVGQLLTPEQLPRFHQLEIQSAGPMSFERKDVQDTLGITDKQRSSITSIIAQVSQARLAASRSGDLAAIRKVRDESNVKIMALLTADQTAQYKRMLGDPFDFGPAPSLNSPLPTASGTESVIAAATSASPTSSYGSLQIGAADMARSVSGVTGIGGGPTFVTADMPYQATIHLLVVGPQHRYATATLKLNTRWVLESDESAWSPKIDPVDHEDGKADAQYSGQVGSAGFAEEGSDTVALPFVSMYRESGDPHRVHFRLGKGELKLWWSDSAASSDALDRTVILMDSWLDAATDLPASTDHPQGGISLLSPPPDGGELVFALKARFTSDGMMASEFDTLHKGSTLR